ncbi:hypothetical protein BXZ70DRAFT_696117 [Cristinia sonorae]|uniref:Uncharacterized protein n=1 Tax=Cristinia sonorae TaxID=1940300 RepID=A0A8K0UDD3_9AGAR|nr:hypothetical protein BXZ70DRAFT_696117 [Cristinia sonorae]
MLVLIGRMTSCRACKRVHKVHRPEPDGVADTWIFMGQSTSSALFCGCIRLSTNFGRLRICFCVLMSNLAEQEQYKLHAYLTFSPSLFPLDITSLVFRMIRARVRMGWSGLWSEWGPSATYTKALQSRKPPRRLMSSQRVSIRDISIMEYTAFGIHSIFTFQYPPKSGTNISPYHGSYPPKSDMTKTGQTWRSGARRSWRTA